MSRACLHCLAIPMAVMAASCIIPVLASGNDHVLDSCPCLRGGDTPEGAVSSPNSDCCNGSRDKSQQAELVGTPYIPVVEPPPGTLGRTYQLPARPVPASKHPRVGMIDVCCPTAEHVIVRWTNDYRTEETLKGVRDDCDPSLWHFESKPLVPGLSQIYRVEIYTDGPGSPPAEVRYVRLIMGRVVFLTV